MPVYLSDAMDEASPSPRRAWIEIVAYSLPVDFKLVVALPTEGVD